MSEEQTSYVVHRTEPEAPSIQIKTGLSATGKLFHELNVHGPDVTTAIALLDEARRALVERGIIAAESSLEDQLSAMIAALSEAKS